MAAKLSNKNKKLEVVLWSIALPGFAQLINHQYVKGILFIGLEFLINVMGNLNTIIVLSFNLKIEEAIAQTNYLWLMFYPCLYFYAIWDAYKNAGGGEKAFAYLPLAFSAYFVTVGVIFFTKLHHFWHFNRSFMATHPVYTNWFSCRGTYKVGFIKNIRG